MYIKIYSELTKDAVFLREEVFVNEQGFKSEFDEIDAVASHYVLYDEQNYPIAVCRSFLDNNSDNFTIGRLAVIKKYRGLGLGKKILTAAEDEIKKHGGKFSQLHAQVTAKKFYEACGYTSFGEIDFDEDCPHIWMKKEL